MEQTEESLVCTLVHKFGGKDDDDAADGAAATKAVVEALRRVPPGWKAQGHLQVFVDECHRTQSGDLHKAMNGLLPSALFIGFTGTPLLKAGKARSIEVFGRYIHTYRFDQAVREGVVLDLRYEARDIDQSITAQKKIDEWFEAKTKGLNDLAKAQLRQKWGTMQRVLSSPSRLEKIVADILLDMSTRPRLMDGHGNAMPVAGSIYEACKFYELLAKTELKGKCAIVTSYMPTTADAKGEATGEGETDNLRKYQVYRQMLADRFNEPEDVAAGKVELFEKQAKKRFIEQPGQLKLLIVVDIRAEESEKISAFDDLSLIQLIVDRGAAAIDALPASIRKNQTVVTETIENNVRRLIVKELPVDPAYYEKMSKLLDALIAQRRQGVIDYKEYLDEIAALTKAATTPGGAPASYPPAVDTPAKRALYNNLGKDGTLTLAIDAALQTSRHDGWRSNAMKLKRVRAAIHAVTRLATSLSRLTR